MPVQELLKLLGRPTTDPRVEAALVHYEIEERPSVKIDLDDADGPVVDTQAWVKNASFGIEFGFDDQAAWNGWDETQYGRRDMLLTQIYMYGNHPGVERYPEPLPFGLEFADNRRQARDRLSAYEGTLRSHVRDTWEASGACITVSYTDDEAAIAFVLCAAVEPPLPPLSYALAPVPEVETLVGLLGRQLDDPALRIALRPLGLEDRVSDVTESGEAALLNPYGLTLGFSIPRDRSGRNRRQLVLSRVLLVSERELGGREWPGDLPRAMTFADSPEMAVRKMGRAPDEQEDDDFTGYAIWHEPDASVHVLYNAMENRLARVSLIAPGYWEMWHHA